MQDTHNPKGSRALSRLIRFLLATSALLAIALNGAVAQNPAPAPPTAQIAPLPPPMPAFPEDGTGLCQCSDLTRDAPKSDHPDTHELGLKCMATVDECKSACGVTRFYSYVPHAGFSCPLTPGEAVRPVALNTLRRMRFAAQ